MPAMMSWPVSSFSLTVKVGSSRSSWCSALSSFVRSERVRGSMAMEMTGSGKCISPSRTGNWSLPIVSPVCASLKPTTTATSPAPTLARGSERLACMRKRRLMRSRLRLATLYTAIPSRNSPE